MKVPFLSKIAAFALIGASSMASASALTASEQRALRPIIEGPHRIVTSASHLHLRGSINLNTDEQFYVLYKFPRLDNWYQVAGGPMRRHWTLDVVHLKRGFTAVYLHLLTFDGTMSRDVKVIIHRIP